MDEAKWYVAHTYSGYENNVRVNILKTVENRNLQDQIFDVLVPVETVVEVNNGKPKTVERKIFPGYVFVKMVMNDDSWYVVRNTRGVTGFVGPGSKPVPLTDAEMASMGLKVDAPNVPFTIGDSVLVKSGVWEGTTGIVRKIDHEERMVTISIDIFGRETPTELSFNDVEAV